MLYSNIVDYVIDFGPCMGREENVRVSWMPFAKMNEEFDRRISNNITKESPTMGVKMCTMLVFIK